MRDIITYAVLPITGSVFIVAAIFQAMKQIGMNRELRTWQRRGIVAIYIIFSTLLSLFGNGLINLAGLMLIPVIGYFCYNRDRLYIIYDICFVVAVYLTDLLVTLGAGLIQQNTFSFMTNRATYIGLIISDRVIEYLILKVLVALIRRKGHGAITKGQLLGSLLLPISSIVLLLSMTSFLQVYMSMENLLLLIVDIAILLLLNIFVTSLFDTMGRNNQLQRELELYQQQALFQQKYYEKLEQKYQSTRTLVHDIRNHIQMMERLYEEQENETGIQYTRDIHEILNQLGQKYYTSHKMLNMILNDKTEQMQSEGITADIKIAEVDFTFLREMDMTIVFGNLLDNAIAAAAASHERRISLRIAKVHDFISITFDNTAEEAPKQQAGRLLSHKQGHEALGLKNVERVVAAYKGEIEYEWRDGHFITRIMFGI